MATKVMEQLPNARRKAPDVKDWNEQLKNYFNFEQQQQRQQQQQQRQQEPRRGFSR